MNALLNDLDLENTDAEQVEKEIALGGAIPAGKYHARLLGSEDRQAGSFEVVRLTFELLAKPFAGKEIHADIFVSGPFENEKKEKISKNNRIRFLHTLGVLQKVTKNGKSQYSAAPGKATFNDVIGQQCILDVTVEERDGEGKYAGRKFKENRVAIFGIYDVNAPECKDVERCGNVAAPIGQNKSALSLDDI